jgi:TnpA family transposase
LLGFREASVADAEALGAWLRDHAVAKTRDPAELAADAEARCRSLRIEPPAPDRIARIVRAAVHAYEDKRVATVHARLTSAMRVGLDALLQSPGPQGAAEVEDMAAPDGKSDATLIHLRAGPGRASVVSLRDELARLDTVRGLGLPDDLFADWSRNELEACRQRVAVEAPYELRRHPDAARHAWLAAYAHLRGRTVIDTLVDLLIETVHHIGARAEHRVEQDLLDDLKCVGGKQALLYRIAGAAAERPDGSVREVLYPVVGEQTFRDLVREAKATGPTYRTTLRATIRSSYRGHYRRAVLDLLAALDFRSNNDAHRPVIQALDLVRRYAGTRLQTYPAEETVPIDGVVRPLWRDAVVESDPQGRPRVNRITYEICAIEALREQLRCKEIWVAGADRYRNPDEDLPADFDARREEHYAALGLPRSADAFLAGLQEDMRVALSRLDRDLPRNPDVRISRKAGGWIHLTPLQPRPPPVNIDALKTDVADAWPMTSLLDMLKEADLRVGFTDYLRSCTAYEALDRGVLRPRLLLSLNGLGTNAGLKRMASSHLGASYKDLLYVRRRYINPDQLREAIAAVTNATLRARDPLIWGEGTNACASDSKHFGAWGQNLTTQWHVRYGGRVVMIYWHVERKSLCIHSQLKSPSSSEVASMIEGVLRHCIELEVDRQYVDSHGQSVVAFAFTKLLGFQLLPRLKAIHAQRLYRPDTGQPDAYPNLQPVLSRPIDWELIGRQYDEMVKYATAMRLGTADAEAILRRFTQENTQHPTYKALSKLGKAVKTAFPGPLPGRPGAAARNQRRTERRRAVEFRQRLHLLCPPWRVLQQSTREPGAEHAQPAFCAELHSLREHPHGSAGARQTQVEGAAQCTRLPCPHAAVLGTRQPLRPLRTRDGHPHPRSRMIKVAAGDTTVGSGPDWLACAAVPLLGRGTAAAGAGQPQERDPQGVVLRSRDEPHLRRHGGALRHRDHSRPALQAARQGDGFILHLVRHLAH